MTDERIDALIRQLDVDSTPDINFVRRSFAVVQPVARSARVHDAGTVGRVWRQVEGIGAWRGRPAVATLRNLVYLAVLLALILVLAATLAFLGRQPAPTPSPPVGRNGLVAYTTLVRGGTGDQSVVHLVNPDGTGDREINSGICPTLLGTARLAYWAHPFAADLTDLTIAPIAGAAADARHAQLRFGYPQKLAISPDGTRVVEPTADSGLSLTSLDQGTRTILVRGPLPDGAVPGYAVWSPDGQQIAFTAVSRLVDDDTVGAYRSAIYVVDVAGVNLRQLSSRPGTDAGSLAWSADGRLIAFAAAADESTPVQPHAWLTATPAMDIFVIGVDGAREANLTKSGLDEFGQVWSPDGQRLAYLRYDPSTSTSHLVVVQYPDLGSTDNASVLESGPLGIWSGLTWSPDGTLLIGYTSAGDVATIPASLDRPPTPLVSRVATVFDDCGPSWQRLEP